MAGWAERHLAGLIPAVLGAAAFAVPFLHVEAVARWAGQPAWAAWPIAASIELMAIASALEIRRRRQIQAALRRVDPAARVSVAWPVGTLLLGVAMSAACNLAAAGPHALPTDTRGHSVQLGPWVQVMALWPVVAFLAVAGQKATRAAAPAPEREDRSPDYDLDAGAPLPTDAAPPLPETTREALPSATRKALPAGASRSRPGSAPAKPQASAGGRSPGRTGRSPDQIVARAVEVERAALADTGRGLSYRAAQQALGVRYPDAKTALDTARAQLAEAEQTAPPQPVDLDDNDAPPDAAPEPRAAELPALPALAYEDAAGGVDDAPDVDAGELAAVSS